MDVNRIYATNTERVQPLNRVQKVNLPSFEQQREDITKHYSNQAEEQPKPRNYAHFLHQDYKNSRFHQIIQPYGFKKNAFIAAATCIYVDHTTVKQMITYAANHEEYPWDDMGFDGNCKWVVINGQRFECKFTVEEIECYEQMFQGTTYTQFLDKETQNDVRIHISVSFNHEKRLQFLRQGNFVQHPKVNGLIRNEMALKFVADVMNFYHVKQLVMVV